MDLYLKRKTKALRKCLKGHKPTIIECDLSRAYGSKKYAFMWHIRCDVGRGSCEFGEYYFRLLDAINDWNESKLQ